MYHWDNEVVTCEKEYDMDSMAIFNCTKIPLVYRKEAMVNWDP